MHILILLIAFTLPTLTGWSQSKKIWIDTDIMIGKSRKDVDDGLALILALQDTSIDIKGISVIQDIDYGYDVTKRLINWYHSEREIPVYKGAKSFEEFGLKTNAVEAMAKALERESMTLVVLGPATNVATLLDLYPHLAGQIEELVFCMGRRPDMHFNPGREKTFFSDYNFDLDPASMQKILETDIKITLSCYEASVFVYLNKQDIKVLKNTGHPGDQWVYKQLKAWNRVWRIFIGSKKGFVPWDAITIGHLLSPQYFEWEEIPIEIQILPNDSKRINKDTKKPYLLVSHDFERKRMVQYYYKTAETYEIYLLNKFSRGK